MKALAITALMLLAVCCYGAQGSSTAIKEASFTLSLPGTWEKVIPQRDASLYIYRADSEQQVTVSIFLATPRLAQAELEKTLHTLIEARLASEVKEDPGATMLAPTFSKQKDALTAFYQGRSASGRRFASFAIVNGAGFANVYYEALLPADEFAARAKKIFEEVSFAH